MRIAAFLLAILLLSGCARQRPVQPQTEAAALPTESAAGVTEPVQTQPPETEPVQTQPPETEPTIPPEPTAPPEDDALVHIRTWIPGIGQELRYAGEDNFTGQQIYPFTEGYLRYGTVKKLAAAQERLAEQGLSLKIWDAYRPVSAQWTLWQVCPDPRYVADPRQGSSNHSRGSAVDVTLVDSQGRELDMPTDFDDFSARADRDYADCTEIQAANARLLEQVMKECGFQPYWQEWWHFSDTDGYPVEGDFQPPVG